jgi:NodT family efflux transporter outer membrane factor (OMF) lipoprotein
LAVAGGDVPAAAGKRFADQAAKGIATGIVTQATGIPFAIPNAAFAQIPGPRDGINTGPFNSFAAGFDSSWEIDVFGGIRRSVESADANLQRNVERYRDVLVSVLAEVALNYIEVRTLQERIRFAQENVIRQQKSLELATARFDTGLSPRLDIEQARSNLANTEAEIPLLRIGMVQAINRIGILLGEYPAALHDELMEPGAIPVAPPEVATGMPVDIIRRRPDIRAAERTLAAFNARIGVATADILPRFSLSGAFALTGTDIKHLGNINAREWSFGPSMRWNIFDGLRNINRIYAAYETTHEARVRYEQAILLGLEEVENSMIGYKQLQVRRDALGRAVTASAESVKLVRDLYENGLTDFQNVLDTERTLFLQQDAYAETQGQVVLELIALYKALGGGWRTDEPEGVEDVLGPGLLYEEPVEDPMATRVPAPTTGAEPAAPAS